MITQAQKTDYLSVAYDRFGETATGEQLASLANEGYPKHSWLRSAQYRIAANTYRLPLEEFGIDMNRPNLKVVDSKLSPMKKTVVQIEDADGPSIPEKDPLYVRFGFYSSMKSIIQSQKFYPVFVSGLSGNGKTMMVEQVCAELGREFVRVNVSSETSEDDLIGGFRLVDGNTVWFDGPVIQAMKAGAVLCLDEIDRGTNKLMCIQGILEGKPYRMKKTGQVVAPADGFNIIATANTKGQGDDSGRFMAAMILDDAFLERFPITVEQEYPSTKVETKILERLFNKLEIEDVDFATFLVRWADVIRKTFQDGAIDNLISTRRLVHIAQAFSIFKDRKLAVEYCINRFDQETKTAFMDLYSKIDMNIVPKEEEVSPPQTEAVPF